MPHYKCVACKTRLHTAARPPNQVGDLCPQCGALLEPVGSLTELVGYRAIQQREKDDSGRHQRIADRAYDFLGYRDRRITRAQIETERWVDEGGSVVADDGAGAAGGR